MCNETVPRCAHESGTEMSTGHGEVEREGHRIANRWQVGHTISKTKNPTPPTPRGAPHGAATRATVHSFLGPPRQVLGRGEAERRWLKATCRPWVPWPGPRSGPGRRPEPGRGGTPEAKTGKDGRNQRIYPGISWEGGVLARPPGSPRFGLGPNWV